MARLILHFGQASPIRQDALSDTNYRHVGCGDLSAGPAALNEIPSRLDISSTSSSNTLSSALTRVVTDSNRDYGKQ